MFIFLSADNQTAKARKNAGITHRQLWSKPGSAYRENIAAIRRPYRGIQIKEDRYAVIAIKDSKGEPILLESGSMIVDGTNAAGTAKGKVAEYADFILQRVEVQRVEKQQIIETFGDAYVFFFGERPVIASISGILINSEDFNWRSTFWYNYENYMRGTKLVQQNAKAYLAWDTIVIEGYPVQASAVDDSQAPYHIQFSMSMLLTNSFDFSNIGSTLFPGFGSQPNLDVLNSKLAADRAQYVSTTASVRYGNAIPSKRGMLASIRDGIKSATAFASDPVTGVFGDYIRAFDRVVGGRTVRMPIGVAGYLINAGQAQIAGGSSDPLLNDFYDNKTGELKTLTGSVKLRMPSYSKFAPVGFNWRTYKSENYDEYPLRKERTLKELLGGPLSDEWIGYQKEMLDKAARKKEEELYISFWNGLANAESFLDDLAGVVDGLASGFALVSTAISYIRDFENIIPAMFQFGGLKESFANSDFGLSIFAGGWKGPEDVVKSKKAQFSAFRGSKYIGEGVRETFSAAADNARSNIDPATGRPYPVSIGEAYAKGDYVSTYDAALQQYGESRYEEVYGESDYASVIDRAQETAVDPEDLYNNEYITQLEQRTGEQIDPEELYAESGYISQAERAEATEATLDEVYGNNDYAPTGSEITPIEIEELYTIGGEGRPGSQAYRSVSTMSPEERLAVLQRMQNSINEEEPDANTAGIRGVNDEDSNIEPVV